MQLTFASMALAAASAVTAQGVSGVLLPPTPSPPGNVATYPSPFEITVYSAQTKRDVQVERRDACAGSGTLVATLKNGILTDAHGRIGAIVANHQFQFDGPPAQTGSLYTGGWSVGQNGSLAIGGSARFYECLSGNFYNLYDQNIGGQCLPIEIDIIPCGSSAGASQSSDGQVVATSAGTKITQISDGQVQATSAGNKITQISDGQIQATSAVSRRPVSQYTDGQLQVPTGKPVSQISDGQVQAPTATKKPVSQISDGQVQAPTATKKPVSQISDGQIQAPTTIITRAPVTQISDGQIQAPTSKPAVVTQISDGQVQAPNATSTRARVTANAGAAATIGAQLLAGVAAAAGFAML